MAKRTTTKKAGTKKKSGSTTAKKTTTTTTRKAAAKKPVAKKTTTKKNTTKTTTKPSYKTPAEVLKKVENTKRYIKGLKTKLSKNPKGELKDSNYVLDMFIEKLEKIING